MNSVLWIDDQVNDYSEFIAGLGEHDISVTAAPTVDEAIDILRHKNFDLILLDLRMPEKSGFDFLRDYLSRTNVSVCVLSSYLHLEEYQKRLNRLRSNIAIMDKDLPPPKSPSFEYFAERIKHFILNPPGASPKSFENEMREKFAELDPFEISFRRYLRLPSRLKKHLRTEAEKRARNAINAEFRSGAGWVLICGDPHKADMSADVGTTPPDNEVVRQRAIELDRVPYQFSAPLQVDDMHTGACQGPTDISDYPTLTLEVEGAQLVVHFDTGSPYTFVSFEEFNYNGALREDLLPIDGRRGVMPYEYVSDRIRARVIDQKKGSSKAVMVQVRAIKNWQRSPFSVFCPQICANFEQGLRNTCSNRKALIGRNIMFENKLSLVLCGSTNKTSISRSRK